MKRQNNREGNKFSFNLAVGLAFCLLLCISRPTAAADWPRFLGPNGNNISSETNLLDKWPESGPQILWENRIGNGYSAPSVQGNQLALFHRQGDEEILELMEAETGKTIWQHKSPTAYTDPYGYNNGPRCTPLMTSNRCYTFGAEGRLTCHDLATGAPVWVRETRKDWKVPPPFFGVGSTPLLEDDRVYVMVGAMPDAGVVALEAATGKTLWENVGQKTWEGQPKTGWNGEPPVNWAEEDKQASYSSPTMATIHGRRHLLCFTRQGLVSLDPATGKVNFKFWFRCRVTESVNAVTPVVSGDLILISSAYYKTGSVLLRVKPDGQGVEEVWRGLALEIHWNTPILHAGKLYAFSGRNEPDANFRCVELLTGKILWDRNESWPSHSTRQPKVFGRGSAIMADGKLIVLGEGGLLGLFRVNAEKAEELCRWQAPSLRYPCWAAPVLAGGRLFLRGESRLLCLKIGM